MEWHELSPHDETILFQLVEIERSLPREEQSRRFNVRILHEPGKAPEALIQPAATVRKYRLKTDAQCFGELEKAGYIRGSFAGYPIADATVFLSIMSGVPEVFQLLEPAFTYHDEKHDFPTSLADERREFVDSRISTVYPEAIAHLKKGYDAIWIEQPEGNWSSVAHDCETALRSFAAAIYKQEYASKLGEQVPSSADFEQRLQQTIRATCPGEELRGLLVKLIDYVTARRHDMGTTREEAKRCVLLTYLLVGEIWDVLASSQAT